MKRFLALSVLLTGIGLATPALAGQRGHSRGHRVVRGGYHSCSVHGYRYPRYNASAYFRVARPRLAVGWYAPAPAYYYGPPVYFDADRIWVTGHYVRDRGARIWIGGHWSR